MAWGNAPKAPPLPKGPVQKAAAQRVLNKASGKMETKQAMQNYRRPAPVGRQVSSTKQTTTRETPVQPTPTPSFINQTPTEVEALAHKLTNAEVSGIRAGYQPEQALLGQEQSSALAGHAASYGQLGSQIGGLQGQQAASAKTFENYAADAVSKAATAVPGASQTAAALGLKPGEALPESVQKGQEGAKSTLAGIASSAQAGTNARQEGQATWLQNMQGVAALGNAEGARNIEGQYGKSKQESTNREGAAVAKATSGGAALAQRLFGEQEKDRIAATGLNYKGVEAQNKTALASSKVSSERNKEKEGVGKLKVSEINARSKAESTQSLAEYRKATGAEKERMDSANITDKEGKLKELGRKNKIAEEKAGPGGTKVSAAQKSKYEKEMTTALNAFERGPNLETAKAGRDYQRIRNELTAGENVKVGGKAKLIKGQAVNPVILNAMEQVFRYHYVNPETKKALAALGLPSEGLSNLLLRK